MINAIVHVIEAFAKLFVATWRLIPIDLLQRLNNLTCAAYSHQNAYRCSTFQQSFYFELFFGTR